MLLVTIAIIIVFIAIIVSQFIVDPQLQPVYWMVVLLLFVSVANIYMSIYYYIKLRNEPGIKGERGDSGNQGESGSPGVCTIDTECDALQNCRELIDTILRELLPSYKEIKEKEANSIELSDADKDKLSQVDGYIELIIPKCESGLYSRDEMKSIIKKSFNDNENIIE